MVDTPGQGQGWSGSMGGQGQVWWQTHLVRVKGLSGSRVMVDKPGQGQGVVRVKGWWWTHLVRVKGWWWTHLVRVKRGQGQRVVRVKGLSGSSVMADTPGQGQGVVRVKGDGGQTWSGSRDGQGQGVVWVKADGRHTWSGSRGGQGQGWWQREREERTQAEHWLPTCFEAFLAFCFPRDGRDAYLVGLFCEHASSGLKPLGL